MHRHTVFHCDERKRNLCFGHTGQIDLCLLCRFFDTLHCHLVFGEIHAVFFLELARDPIHNAFIEVIAAQAVVACGCKNFKHTVAQFKDRNVERAAAEVEDEDFLILVLVLIDAVCECRRRRLVDDTFHLKTCDLACVLCCLTLRVREVCRNGDNRFGNLLAEIFFRVVFEFGQNHCGDLLRSVFLIFDFYFIIRTHLSLDGTDGMFGICDCLTFCDFADESFAVLCKRNH